jgi:hypothetical protein
MWRDVLLHNLEPGTAGRDIVDYAHQFYAGSMSMGNNEFYAPKKYILLATGVRKRAFR